MKIRIFFLVKNIMNSAPKVLDKWYIVDGNLLGLCNGIKTKISIKKRDNYLVETKEGALVILGKPYSFLDPYPY